MILPFPNLNPRFRKDNPNTRPAMYNHTMFPPPALLSTGYPALDLALGGGCPPGALVELSGPVGSGKTSLCQQLAASCQRRVCPVAWIDCDHTFDPAYARRGGVDLAGLYLAQPGWLEAALDMAGCLLQNGAVGLLVLDGLDALPGLEEARRPLAVQPEEEQPDEAYKRLLSPWLRQVRPALRLWQTTLLVTHQGGSRRLSQAYHSLAGQLGRLALPLQAALRIQLEPGELLHNGNGKAVCGQRINARILKNRLKTSLQLAEFDIMYSQDIY